MVRDKKERQVKEGKGKVRKGKERDSGTTTRIAERTHNNDSNNNSPLE